MDDVLDLLEDLGYATCCYYYHYYYYYCLLLLLLLILPALRVCISLSVSACLSVCLSVSAANVRRQQQQAGIGLQAVTSNVSSGVEVETAFQFPVAGSSGGGAVAESGATVVMKLKNLFPGIHDEV